ncbi:MAG: c-type cytochrome [Burkholderiales bacterium]
MPGSPSLAAQPRLFLENQMVMIREGLRDIAVMRGMLKGFTDAELSAVARFYSVQPLKPQRPAADALRVTRGAALSKAGICGTCHLPDYAGREQIPRLAGQREDYLFISMRDFRDGTASGRDTIMAASLRGMSDDELRDLAHYFALKP